MPRVQEPLRQNGKGQTKFARVLKTTTLPPTGTHKLVIFTPLRSVPHQNGSRSSRLLAFFSSSGGLPLRGTNPCVRALVPSSSCRAVFLLLLHGGRSPRLSAGEEVGSPHLPPKKTKKKKKKATSFLQGWAGGQKALVSPARPTLPP